MKVMKLKKNMKNDDADDDFVFRWSLASWWHFGGVSVSFDGVR